MSEKYLNVKLDRRIIDPTNRRQFHVNVNIAGKLSMYFIHVIKNLKMTFTFVENRFMDEVNRRVIGIKASFTPVGKWHWFC